MKKSSSKSSKKGIASGVVHKLPSDLQKALNSLKLISFFLIYFFLLNE